MFSVIISSFMESSTRILHLSDHYVLALPFLLFLFIITIILIASGNDQLENDTFNQKIPRSTWGQAVLSEKISTSMCLGIVIHSGIFLWYMMTLNCFLWWFNIETLFYCELEVLFRKGCVSNKSSDFQREGRLSPHCSFVKKLSWQSFGLRTKSEAKSGHNTGKKECWVMWKLTLNERKLRSE